MDINYKNIKNIGFNYMYDNIFHFNRALNGYTLRLTVHPDISINNRFIIKLHKIKDAVFSDDETILLIGGYFTTIEELKKAIINVIPTIWESQT